MARPFQPHASFSIENNGDKKFSIDSILTDKDQESVMLSEM